MSGVTMQAQAGSRLRAMAGDIKLSHSVFALPFALLATFVAAGGFPGWAQVALIVVCMGFARTFAMLANRYFDRDIDALNPRTAGRAIPAGRLRARDVMLGMIVCAAGLVGGAAMFGVVDGNWWPAIFSPLVLLWLGAYGLTKRFTLLCHFVLGAALAISPLAAALAINPAELARPGLWFLAAFVLLWVGGFDVIYALQDIEVDRRLGLHSIPAALGPRNALRLAQVAHVAALVMLVMFYRTTPGMGPLFLCGIAAVGALLAIEHHAAAAGRFNMAFFTVNGVISCVLGGLGIADVFV